ncbi:MAG: HD domain-containing phosphohydrolase [Planctomycetota bacterium]
MSETKSRKSLSAALNSGVRKYGSSIVSNLAIAIKTTQLYSFQHQNVVDAVRELEEFITSFIRLEGEAELCRVEEFLFINEVRIKADLGGMQTYDLVVDLFREREIGKLVFTEGVSSKELSRLIDALTKPVDENDGWKGFEAELGRAGLSCIRASKYEIRQEVCEDISDDKRMIAINLFFRAIQQTKETIEAVQNSRKINFKRLKRTIQAIVDTVIDDEPTLVALTNVKDYGSRLANHSVNVAVLSVALGSRLGLSKKLLGDLGISALLHDLGKVKLSDEVLSTPRDDLDPETRRALEDHVYTGVELLLNQRIVDAVVKSMNVAFLHHFRFDSTGFPRTHVVKAQNFYSRVVAVCDYYDNSSAKQPGGGKPLGADVIMRTLLGGSGTEFDPLVVKAFVNLLGLYPVGCIVSLDTGEVGTVVSPANNPKFLDRPTVRLFSDPDGNTIDSTVNLMDRDGSGFTHSILKLYQQEEVELEMEEYLSVI